MIAVTVVPARNCPSDCTVGTGATNDFNATDEDTERSTANAGTAPNPAPETINPNMSTNTDTRPTPREINETPGEPNNFSGEKRGNNITGSSQSRV